MSAWLLTTIQVCVFPDSSAWHKMLPGILASLTALSLTTAQLWSVGDQTQSLCPRKSRRRAQDHLMYRGSCDHQGIDEDKDSGHPPTTPTSPSCASRVWALLLSQSIQVRASTLLLRLAGPGFGSALINIIVRVSLVTSGSRQMFCALLGSLSVCPSQPSLEHRKGSVCVFKWINQDSDWYYFPAC